MIPEVDEALRRLLRASAPTRMGCDVTFDAPTRDWAARRTGPTVDAYLFDIREDVTRRERGPMAVRDGRGVVTTRRNPPRWFRLSYLVTAWTSGADDEHRLLAAVLGGLLRHETLPLPEGGSLAAFGAQVPLDVAVPAEESRSISDIWSALGGDLKPSLDVLVIAPFPVAPDLPAGPPVTEGLGVIARRRDTEEAAPTPRVRRTVPAPQDRR